MGMFDSIDVILDKDGVSPFRCAAGHNVFEFQTKDLNDLMDSYKIIGSRLYGPTAKEGAWQSVFEMVGADLIERMNRVYPPSKFTGQLTVYTSCPECDPVVYENPGASWNGGVAERSVWCEYLATFKDGLLIEVAPEKLETRDEIRKATVGALSDDDRVAKKHIAQFKARGH